MSSHKQHHHDHNQGHDQDCAHDHKHDHDAHECGCGHGHSHVHEHDHTCGCGHGHGGDCHHEHGEVHDHDHACGCSHDHEHAHDHTRGHEHDHDRECGCGCGHDHECGCGHDHDVEASTHELSAAPNFSYRVLGLDCPSCALNVQNAVLALACVEDARLIYATATLEVVLAPGADVVQSKRQVLGVVRSCGEDLELDDEERQELEAERSWFAQNREKILMGLSAFALVAGLVSEHFMGSEQRAIPFYVCAAIAGLVYIAPMAFASLRRRTADMNVLMGTAVIGALVMGFMGDTSVFGDAAIVIFLAQVGEWLEGWSMRKTSGSIRDLMDLAPSVSHVVTPDGDIVDVQTKGVSEGYTIRVLPGERVPLDGVIVQGNSSFNEAPVTGESVPCDKGVGAEVYAGSLNANGVVDVRVTADEDCTTLARIISQVQGAQARKAPYESFVNRFAAAYTPIVVAGALVVGIGVPLVLCVVSGGLDVVLWHDWAYRACSLLVVACPCALVISTPVTFVSALSRAARDGVLVKGGAYFDLACKVSHVTFDKTGTLTTGKPQVTRVVTMNNQGENDVLALACALEVASTHPLARAVTDEARSRNIAVPAALEVEEVAANGMRGFVDGQSCVVGKLAFVDEHASVGPLVVEATERLGNEGATALVVTCDGTVWGVVGIADTLRDSVPAVLEALRGGDHPRTLEMLTGDNRHTANAMASEAGITSVRAELLPSQKLDRIGELQEDGGVVAMVGDGINDAPALAKADIGITMGAAASDTALEVADVALLSDSLMQLPAFFTLSRRAMNVVRENIVCAIAVKVLVFALVVLGVAGMGAAVFADTGVALIVVLNGMRLMYPSKHVW